MSDWKYEYVLVSSFKDVHHLADQVKVSLSKVCISSAFLLDPLIPLCVYRNWADSRRNPQSAVFVTILTLNAGEHAAK